MKLLAILILLCGGTVLAQYDDLDIGAPPPGRPPLRRQRFQAEPTGRGAAPAPNAIRLRRPGPARPQQLQTEVQFLSTPPQLEPTPAPAPISTQGHPLPLLETPAPPPAVEEVVSEDDFELDDAQLGGPRPAVFAPRPQSAAFRPGRPAFRQAQLVQDSGPLFRHQIRPTGRPQALEQDLGPVTIRPQIRPTFRPQTPLAPLEQDLAPVTVRPQTRPPFRPPSSATLEDDLPVTVRPQTRPAFRPPSPGPIEQDLVPVTARPQLRPAFRAPPEQDFEPAPRQQQRPSFRGSPAPQQVQPTPPPARRPQQPQQQYPRPHNENEREKKPVSQVLRRYRDDNPDGSITWGFENDDGTFKEETIGVDCMVRGKYGYYDPDGVKREYTYSSGIPCDKEQKAKNAGEGFIDYQTNKYVLPNGDQVDLGSVIKNKARRPAPNYRV